MRAFFSEEFMPSIHHSSFEAVPARADESADPILEGFLEQTRNVLVGVRAALDRALQEGWSIVLEGVHLVPGLLPTDLGDALIGSCILHIADETAHAQHFFTRDRPVAKYLDRFAEIRRVQEYLVEQARRTNTPVIENENAELATRAVAELVLSAAERT
jgi:2-phosphoglycerate kinase